MTAMTCAEAVRRLWDYLDDLLAESDHTHVAAHLAHCRRCCGELEFIEELRRVLAQAGQVADGELPAEVQHRFNDTLERLGP
jgi:anti-sigma factor RsiW